MDRNPVPRLSIGYYMNDAQLVGTGDDGKILYRARTRRLRRKILTMTSSIWKVST